MRIGKQSRNAPGPLKLEINVREFLSCFVSFLSFFGMKGRRLKTSLVEFDLVKHGYLSSLSLDEFVQFVDTIKFIVMPYIRALT